MQQVRDASAATLGAEINVDPENFSADSACSSVNFFVDVATFMSPGLSHAFVQQVRDTSAATFDGEILCDPHVFPASVHREDICPPFLRNCGHPASLTELVCREALLNTDPEERMSTSTLLERLKTDRADTNAQSETTPPMPRVGDNDSADLPRQTVLVADARLSLETIEEDPSAAQGPGVLQVAADTLDAKRPPTPLSRMARRKVVM